MVNTLKNKLPIILNKVYKRNLKNIFFFEYEIIIANVINIKANKPAMMAYFLCSSNGTTGSIAVALK